MACKRSAVRSRLAPPAFARFASLGGFGLDVSLPGLSRADAEALVAKAHQVCPYSNATRGNVDVRLKVV